MAVSRIGTASGTNTCTLPTHQAGDLLIIFAFRDGSNTAPSLPAGWWNYFTETGANTCSIRVGYKVATGAGTSAGTWTNATSVIGVVYRGAAWLGSRASSRGSSTSFSYPALTPFQTNSTSYIGGFVASRDGTNTANPQVQVAPSGMTNVTSVKDTTDAAGFHDSNGATNSFSIGSVSTGVAATGWYTFVFEILENNPTLIGYNVVGSSTNTLTDWFIGSSYDCFRTGSISKLKAYIKANSGTATFDAAIYEETSINNYTFIAKAQSTISGVGTTPSWVEFDLRAAVTIGKRYYIAIWSTSAFTYYFNQTGRQGQTYATTGNTFNTWPTPELGGSTDTSANSIFVEYSRIYSTFNGDGTFTGNLTSASSGGAISATYSGTGTITGTLKGKGLINVVFSGTNLTSGIIKGKTAISSIYSGISTFSSTGNLKGKLTGIYSGDASFSGTTNGKGTLISTYSGTGTTTATLKGKGLLSGIYSGTGSVSATIKGKGYISSTYSGTSDFILYASNTIRATYSGASNFSATVKGKAILHSDYLGTSSFTSSIKGKGILSGNYLGNSNFAGSISAYATISSTFAGQSSFIGTLTEYQPKRRFYYTT